jgi:hypothetical protein
MRSGQASQVHRRERNADARSYIGGWPEAHATATSGESREIGARAAWGLCVACTMLLAAGCTTKANVSVAAPEQIGIVVSGTGQATAAQTVLKLAQTTRLGDVVVVHYEPAADIPP